MNEFQLTHCLYCQQIVENYDYSGNHYAHCKSNELHPEAIHYQIKYNKIYALSITQPIIGQKQPDWYLVYLDMPNFIKSCELHPTGSTFEKGIKLPNELPFTHSLPEIRTLVAKYRKLLIFS